MSYWKQTQTTYADGPTIDAFGNLRTSTPKVIFDSKLINSDQPIRWDRLTSGSAKYSYTSPIAKYEVTASGDYAIAQTRQRFIYEAGNSHRILATFVFGSPTTSSDARVGYYNTSTAVPYNTIYDGIYLERTGSSVNICLANSGSVTAVSQSLWNQDPLNGTGGSGITLDLSKSQILFIDFQWLGVGRVRVGFDIDGKLIYAHEFNFANLSAGVYMRSPNHSVRMELRSRGDRSELSQICCTVQTEGIGENLGVITGQATALTGVNVNNKSAAVLGIRLKSGSLDANVDILSNSVIALTNGNFLWHLNLNPTLTNTPTWVSSTSGSYEYSIAADNNTVTNPGIILNSKMVSTTQDFAETIIENIIHPGARINGTLDELWLTATTTANISLAAAMNVRET